LYVYFIVIFSKLIKRSLLWDFVHLMNFKYNITADVFDNLALTISISFKLFFIQNVLINTVKCQNEFSAHCLIFLLNITTYHSKFYHCTFYILSLHILGLHFIIAQISYHCILNFIFSWWKQYFTYSLRLFIKYFLRYSKS
jgi:hypothetical protein